MKTIATNQECIVRRFDEFIVVWGNTEKETKKIIDESTIFNLETMFTKMWNEAMIKVVILVFLLWIDF